MKIAKLTEEQIQDLLRTALEEGGLAIAKPRYDNDMVADAGTATFTISANGQTKTVSVYALGMDTQDQADAAARAAFLQLASTLTKIDEGGVVTATNYVPTAYRGVLFEAPGVVAPDVRAWPWPDIEIDDFETDPNPNALQLPLRVMTPAEIDALAISDYEGGFQNMIIKAPDGTTYTFSTRPLLPDETE